MREKNDTHGYRYKNNIKSRLNYVSGVSECSERCICIMCKRKRGEETFHKDVDNPEGHEKSSGSEK
jgi:hypothetical protein